MIQLSKLPEPQWLIENAADKTEQYKNAPADKKPSPWRNSVVVAALKAETNGQCMYCEQVVDDTGYVAVEHIAPKSVFPEKVLDWLNLGLACDRCNTNKGHYWTDSPDLRLINPYVDHVNDHLAFRGPMTVAAPGSSRGRNTVRKLKFTDREDLLIARIARLESFDDRLRLWHDESDLEKKQLFYEDVLSDLDPSNEHSAVLTAYALSFGFAF